MTRNKPDNSIKKYYWYGAIAVLILFIFISTVDHEFVNWDDETYIQENEVVQELNSTNLIRMFDPKRVLVGNYHPITELSFALNFAIGGLNPKGYIFFNILLHLINALLVFWIALRLFRSKYLPAIAAILFAIHPMHVESVSWISERKDVLYAFFLLLSFLQYDRYLVKGWRSMYFLSIAMFVLSCLAKAQGVVLAPILLLLHYYRNQLSFNRLVYVLPYFLVSILFGLLAFRSQGGALGMVDLAFIDRIIVAFNGVGTYVTKFLVPIHLSALHPYPEDISWSLFHYVNVLVGIGVLGLTVWSYVKNKRILFLGLAFFWIAVIPVLQFFPVGFGMHAERYTYIPYIGLAWAIIHLLENGKPREFWERYKWSGWIVGTLMVITLSFMSKNRTAAWKNSETLWADVIEKYPDNFIAYVNASDYCRVQGALDRAVYYADLGLRQSGPHTYLYNNKAYAHIVGEKYNEALSVLDEALEKTDPDPQIYVNRGDAFAGLSNYQQAIGAYSNALSIDSDYITAQYRRGRIYLFQTENYAEAINDFDQVLTIEPENADLLTDLAFAHWKHGNQSKAQELISKAEALAPGNSYVQEISRRIY